MTESEWIACESLAAALECLNIQGCMSARKLRLLWIATLRRTSFSGGLTWISEVLDHVEKYADTHDVSLRGFARNLVAYNAYNVNSMGGYAAERRFGQALERIVRADVDANDAPAEILYAAIRYAAHRSWKVDEWDSTNRDAMRSLNQGVQEYERGVVIDLIHDIFGNPFRQVVRLSKAHTDRAGIAWINAHRGEWSQIFMDEWLTYNDGTVRRIAQVIYDEKAFDQMPILADALEDAGCDTSVILTHCRGLNNHVRGCWLLDLILGKS